jgi:hypothetical protein
MAISPGYAASVSVMDDEDGTRREGEGLIMWELAVNSPPPSPTLGPTSRLGYGAVEEVTTRTIPAIKRDKSRGGVIMYAGLLLVSVGVIVSALVLMTKGEFGTFASLYMGNGLTDSGQYDYNDRDWSNQRSFCRYLVCTLTFPLRGEAWLIASLHVHRRNVKLDSDRRSLLRSLEVGSAISLFILWPRECPLNS